MDLNICLFCEKRLFDDNLSFCSSACQAQEATKHCTLIHEADPYLSSRKHPLPLMQKSRMNKRAASFPSAVSSSPLTPASSFEMPHHRRRSFMFSTKDQPNNISPTRNSSLIGDGHASDIAFLSAYMQFHHRAPPVDNASLVSNTSSSGSSDMDSVYTIF